MKWGAFDGAVAHTMAAPQCIYASTPLRTLKALGWTDTVDLLARLSRVRMHRSWRDVETACTELSVGARAWQDQFAPQADEEPHAHGERVYDTLVDAGMTVGQLHALYARLTDAVAEGLVGGLITADSRRALTDAEAWAYAMRAELEGRQAQMAQLEETVAGLYAEIEAQLAHATELRAEIDLQQAQVALADARVAALRADAPPRAADA